MAEIIAEMATQVDQVRTKKGRNTRKALKEKNPSTSESNVVAGNSQPSPTPASDDCNKENHESLSQPRSSPNKGKAASKKQSNSKQSFEKELQEMQEKLKHLHLEKVKTEELLKAKDEMLKQKEQELETRDREQEKLQLELKKLQKLKEFKPTMTFPLPMDKEEDKKKDKKKKNGSHEKKRPSPPYALWCKDQWNEIKKENPEADFKKISNILGAKWKNVSDEEKKPYEEKYLAEKEAYLRVMAKEKRESEALGLLEEEQKQKTAMELLEQFIQFKQEAEKENKKNK